MPKFGKCPPPTLRRCDMGGGFTMMTVYSLVVNAATQNLTTAIIADYAGQRWMEVKIVRLVDLDAVIDCIEMEWGYEGIREDLYSLPVVDAVPVVHAKWIPFHSEAAGDIQYCSACDIGFDARMDYCPHCGARMDGWMEDTNE